MGRRVKKREETKGVRLCVFGRIRTHSQDAVQKPAPVRVNMDPWTSNICIQLLTSRILNVG